MKIKLLALTLVIFLLLISLTGCQKNEVTNEIPTEPTTLQQDSLDGTAGSKIPLKDNESEAEKQIKVAMENYLKETYGKNFGSAIVEVQYIYTTEDEQEIEGLKSLELTPYEVAFDVWCEITPAKGGDYNKFLIPNGEYDKERNIITNYSRIGVLRQTDEGNYVVTNIGTAW